MHSTWHMGFYRFAATVVVACGMAACTPEKAPAEAAKGALVAQVYTYKLYNSDLAEMIPDGTSADDSLRMASNLINTWVHEMVLLYKAEQNLAAKAKNVEKQLQDYRNSLITYAYEKELVRQRLDTTVTPAEIETYYQANQQNFELKDNIIKVLYVKVDKKAPQLPRLRTLCKSDKPQDKQELEKYCRQFAQNYYLDDEAWLLFDDLLKEIPIETYNKELFLQNNRYIEVADSSSLYFVNITGFKIKNSISPLAFERENIRNIILLKRKQELVEGMKKDIYREAVENGEIQVNFKDK